MGCVNDGCMMARSKALRGSLLATALEECVVYGGGPASYYKPRPVTMQSSKTRHILAGYVVWGRRRTTLASNATDVAVVTAPWDRLTLPLSGKLLSHAQK